MRIVITLFIVVLAFSCKNWQDKNGISNAEQLEKEILFKPFTSVNLSSGKLFRLDSLASKYIKPRPVDIWVPEDYSKDKKYAVLYMHDGQMLFDSLSTWNKQEWMVDEWAAQLMKENKVKDFIVVGVWNIRELRNSNYFPEKVFNAMHKKDKDSLIEVGKRHKWINTINSDAYLKFLTQELKPLIDNSFSCLTDKDNTFIMGSSRGGLISMYAISEYPQIFGGAACLSTHWIGTYDNIENGIPDAFFNYMKLNLPDSKNNKIYFDYGTETLDKKYLPYQEKADEIIKGKGHTNNIKFPGTDHSENSWNKRLDIPLTFLLETK